MKMHKIVFYSFTPRAFTSVLIGHLFSVARCWPTVLVSEKMDPAIEALLEDRALFPFLERIISANQFTDHQKNLLSKNRYLCKLARQVINQEKPDIVMTASDMDSLFDLYLIRFAKQAGAKVFSFQSGVDADSATTAKWVEYSNIYRRYPRFFPIFLRVALERLRKWIGHFLYYWVLPLWAGELPFRGKSSFVLRKGISGMRQADYQVVFSNRDFNIYRRAGVPAKKIKILPHPLATENGQVLVDRIFSHKQSVGESKKTVLLLVPAIEGFKSNWKPISQTERLQTWRRIVDLTLEGLPGWQVVISPHPDLNTEGLRTALNGISELVSIASGPIEQYLASSDVIIGLPRSASTVLFTATFLHSLPIIASLDFDQEILGDFYQGTGAITYLNSEDQFIFFLKNISAGVFQGKQNHGTVSNRDASELLREAFHEGAQKNGNQPYS